MNAAWLLEGPAWLRLLVLAGVLLPALFILFSRRCRWWAKILWALASQLSWGFVVLYAWVWARRYPDAADPVQAPPMEDALGWWVLAWPWAVYLLYRATREWFPGERR